MPANDNDPLLGTHVAPPTDAHGHAALVLVESLMHGLVERSMMSSGDAIDVLETAISVQAEIAAVADGAAPVMWRSHALLSVIAASLSTIEPIDDARLLRPTEAPNR